MATLHDPISQPRRTRRKRRRPNPGVQEQNGQGANNDQENNSNANDGAEKPTSRTEDFHKEDALLAFLDKDGDDLMDRKKKFMGLPVLIEGRKSGRWSAKTKRWQNETFQNFTKKPDTSFARRQWRPCAHTIIPFTRLGTPSSDAVLALDRKATYVLCLGTKDESHASQGLALRFYAIPSLSTLPRKRRDDQRVDNDIQCGTKPKASLLQTTPLIHGVGEMGGDSELTGVAEDAIFNFRGAISPATTPVRLLVSRDWKVGLAFLQLPSLSDPGNADTVSTGNLILFTMPSRRWSHSPTRVFTCRNVDINADEEHFTLRNRLWCVDMIPRIDSTTTKNTGTFCNSYYNAPGYLLLNDEGDGFRFTWCIEETFLVANNSCLNRVTLDASLPRDDASSNIVILSSQNSWEESYCDKFTGETMQGVAEKEKCPSQVSVVAEVYLHVDAVLGHILSRRRSMSESKPEFHYNFISLLERGRIANIVIVFVRKKKTGSLGVFVNVDLLTGTCEEQDWVVNKEAEQGSSAQAWCKKLALNRRMKQVRAGPYSVVEADSNAVDWSRLAAEAYTHDADEADDYDDTYWREFVLERENRQDAPKRQNAPPKLVSLSSLYHCCDLISNSALIDCRPVTCIRARDVPLRLVYG